ncbi:hypothetical protein PMIN03_011071 [Paraphaeosphaeria minitans]
MAVWTPAPAQRSTLKRGTHILRRNMSKRNELLGKRSSPAMSSFRSQHACIVQSPALTSLTALASLTALTSLTDLLPERKLPMLPHDTQPMLFDHTIPSPCYSTTRYPAHAIVHHTIPSHALVHHTIPSPCYYMIPSTRATGRGQHNQGHYGYPCMLYRHTHP